MTGIQGAPTANPRDLVSPVPDPLAGPPPGAAGGADPLAGPPPSSGQDALAAGPPQTAQGYHGPGAGLLQASADAAPEALGIAGGIVGRTAGIPGMAAMGMAGAAAGMGYRQLIEQDILGKPAQDPDKNLADIRDASAKVGAELLAGEGALRGVSKAGAAILETKVGSAIADKVSSTVQPVVDYFNNFADTLKKGIIKPAADWLEQNMAQGTAEQSGDTIKAQILNKIGTAYDGFKQSYAAINSVAGDTPMADATREKLSSGIRSDAVGLPNNLYKYVKTYADKIDSASSAQDIHETISAVNQEIDRLSQQKTSSALRDKLGALEQVSDRATDFMENYTHGIATRISKGAATMPEMDAFGKMMAQQANPTTPVAEANLGDYAKSVAQSYIDNRKAVNTGYAGFRAALEDTGVQTSVSTQGYGPAQIMRAIENKPSEQLVSNMFLPKNAAALRGMSQTEPEIFQAVKQARVRDIYNNSMVDGQLNMTKLANNFSALPESSRSLIISNADLAQLRAVADNGNLAAINKLHSNIVAQAISGTVGLARAGALAGSKVVRDAYGTNVGQVLADRLVGGGLTAGANKSTGPQQ